MLILSIKQNLAKIPSFKKVVIGVSGGADSVALAHILKKMGYEIVMAHLNHGLRGKESDADEVFVKQLAKKWRVPLITQRIKGSQVKGENLENRLREIRYQFLKDVRKKSKADFIAVGHHRDDQVETIVMHLGRGAGLRGVCGMPLISDKIIRPLLGVTKQVLVDYLKKMKIPFRTDSTNFNLNLRRNFVRHTLLPELRRQDPTIDELLLSLSSLAQRANSKLDRDARAWIRKNIKKNAFDRESFLKKPDELQSEILFCLAGHEDIYRKPIGEIKHLIYKGKTGKQKKLGKLLFRVLYGKVHFGEISKPPYLSKKPLRIKSEMQWGDWFIENHGANGLLVRPWKPGDRFIPSGMSGSKKLQDFFVDLKIPKSERHRIPIIIDEKGRILGIGNYRVARNAGYLKKLLVVRKMG